MRFLSHIWEAFLRWCAEMFEQKVGVRVMGMGEFCFRKDAVGEMEFLNPMFVMAENYVAAHGLHDRRPKTQAVASDSIELDFSLITAFAAFSWHCIEKPVLKLRRHFSFVARQRLEPDAMATPLEGIGPLVVSVSGSRSARSC